MKKKIALFQKKKRTFGRIDGTLLKPRLSIFKANKHIYAQLIDDEHKITLASSSTLKKVLSLNLKKNATQKEAFLIGQDLGKEALLKGINTISIDSVKISYHGKIKKLIEGLKNMGLFC